MRRVQGPFERQRIFIADASHELKIPLTLIELNVRIVHDEPLDPDDRDLSHEMLAETDRMASVLSDQLLIARLDAEKLPVKRVPFGLASVKSETARRFGMRAASEDVQITIRVPDELRVHSDKERTSQIHSVLLDNALIHTPRGGRVAVV